MRLAGIDELISDKAKREASSAFYPRLTLAYNTSRLYDYGNKSGYTTINEVYYDTASQWQTDFSVNAEYDLFNPDRNFRPYYQAGDNHRLQRINTKLTEKSLMLEMVNLYENLLMSYHSLQIYGQMSEVSLELYNVYKRLNEAGLSDKQVYYMAGVAAADYSTQVINAKRSFAEILFQLKYYTGENYGDNTLPEDFDSYDNITLPVLTEMPEYKAAELKIVRNSTERDMHNLSTFPTVTLFMSYNFNGYDRHKADTSMSDTELSNYRVGINANLTLFSGMSYYYTRSRLQAEGYRLEAERVQILERLRLENERLENSIKYQRQARQKAEEATALVTEVINMGQALKNANITGTAELLERRLDTLEKLLEQRLILIRLNADAARLYVMKRAAESSAQYLAEPEAEGYRFYPEDIINKRTKFKYR
jgi:outer membrane protein TolC